MLYMKKYLIWGALGALSLLQFSCTDIPQYPDGSYTYTEIFRNHKKTASYLNSCYNYIDQYGMSYGGSTFLSAFTDEVQDAQDIINGNASVWYRGGLTPYSNQMGNSYWYRYYEGIRYCNVFLQNIDQAGVNTEKDRQSWKAQAYTLRAFYYFELIKKYGGVPLILEPYPLNYDCSKMTRSSFSDCARQIFSDCDKALSTLDEAFDWRSGEAEADRCKFNKSIAHAIKSYTALYAASPLWSDGTISWEDAERITKEALEACTSHDYTLFTQKPAATDAHGAYDAYFCTRSDIERAKDKETIFELKSQLSVYNLHGLPITKGQTRAGICPSQELVDSYETIDGIAPILGYRDADHLDPIINPLAVKYNEKDPYANRDPRLKASIYYNGAPYQLGKDFVWTYVGAPCAKSATDITRTRTGYYLRKYSNFRSNKDVGNQDGYYKLYRLAQLYLNYAEAAANVAIIKGTVVPSLAISGVSKIRNRVGMPAIDAQISAADFLNKVYNERRVELAFEEDRFYDVRRLKILDKTDRVITGMEVEKESDGTYTYKRVLVDGKRQAYQDKYLILPIPGDEVVRFMYHTGVNFQNPGW